MLTLFSFEGVNENLEFFVTKGNSLAHLGVVWTPSADIVLGWCSVKAHTIKLLSPSLIILRQYQEFFLQFSNENSAICLPPLTLFVFFPVKISGFSKKLSTKFYLSCYNYFIKKRRK